MKDLINSNCSKCREYFKQQCVEETGRCICKDCPRDIHYCILTRWCRETESPLDDR